MFERIMVPVDLARTERLEKALGVAAMLVERAEVDVHLVGVTAVTPSEVAHSPAAYREKLERFAEERSAALGVRCRATALESHDPAVDLDRHLKGAAEALDADLIVMGSHVPRFGDWLTHAHARWLAGHTSRSLFIVR